MNSRERMARAMALEEPDRVPVMCQLSLGHYFLHSGVPPMDVWYSSEGFADALIRLRRRYQFDGVLVNLPGRDPGYEREIDRIERKPGENVIHWRNGNYTVFPHDDNPHYYQKNGTRYFPAFEEVDPDELYYVDPWDLTDITYPYTWGFEPDPRPFDDYFPEWHLDSLKAVLAKTRGEASVHSEVFSPWSQFLELLNYESALMAIMDDPVKVEACLDRLTEGAIDLALRQAGCGVEAVLISSAFAGAGLISREHYERFVAPYEKRLIEGVRKVYRIPVYTHTCGSIGDRLDLILETGAKGVDTLDPPPLGTVELEEAKRLLSGRAFIKGNIDPVHTLLRGNSESIRDDVQWRLRIGKENGGYILSSACSVAPATPPEHLEMLVPLAEEHGRHGQSR